MHPSAAGCRPRARWLLACTLARNPGLAAFRVRGAAPGGGEDLADAPPVAPGRRLPTASPTRSSLSHPLPSHPTEQGASGGVGRGATANPAPTYHIDIELCDAASALSPSPAEPPPTLIAAFSRAAGTRAPDPSPGPRGDDP